MNILLVFFILRVHVGGLGRNPNTCWHETISENVNTCWHESISENVNTCWYKSISENVKISELPLFNPIVTNQNMSSVWHVLI